MTRAEFVQRLVLNSICDDFENVDQTILRQVRAVGTTCGLTIERPEVVNGLRTLVDAGLAKAYALFPGIADAFSGELQGMPPPLDEEDELRPDWQQPMG